MSGLDRFRYEYGAQPLHLLATAGGLLLGGYGILRLTEIPGGAKALLWILLAALLHDLVALPFYSVLLRIADRAAGSAIGDRASMLLALNAVRIPAGLSLLLLVCFLPLILRIDPDAYESVTGLSVDPYLSRWLLISAALFLISGAIYALLLRRGAGAEAEAPRPLPAPAETASDAELRLPLAGRIIVGVVLAGAALAVLWAIAALIVGLLSTGLGG